MWKSDVWVLTEHVHVMGPLMFLGVAMFIVATILAGQGVYNY